MLRQQRMYAIRTMILLSTTGHDNTCATGLHLSWSLCVTLYYTKSHTSKYITITGTRTYVAGLTLTIHHVEYIVLLQLTLFFEGYYTYRTVLLRKGMFTVNPYTYTCPANPRGVPFRCKLSACYVQHNNQTVKHYMRTGSNPTLVCIHYDTIYCGLLNYIITQPR
jgi:hypothetical protein